MSSVWQQGCAVALGVLLSIALNVWTTANPARIPLRRVWLKAFPGFVFSFVIFFVVALPLSEVLSFAVEVTDSVAVQWCLWVLTGLLVSQAPRLKDRHLSRRIAKRIPGAFALIQYLDEISRLYLARMYERESRRASFAWFQAHPDGDWAVDQLFEMHSIDIAESLRRRLPPERQRNSLTVFKIRHRQVKIKFLFRLIGLKEALTQLSGIARRGTTFFHSWPAGKPDRRSHREDPGRSPGRRKYELKGVQDYVLGAFDETTGGEDPGSRES